VTRMTRWTGTGRLLILVQSLKKIICQPPTHIASTKRERRGTPARVRSLLVLSVDWADQFPSRLRKLEVYLDEALKETIRQGLHFDLRATAIYLLYQVGGFFCIVLGAVCWPRQTIYSFTCCHPCSNISVDQLTVRIVYSLPDTPF
jgi:hypothetical protein